MLVGLSSQDSMKYMRARVFMFVMLRVFDIRARGFSVYS
jgi:hypothetical protein